VNKPTKQLHNFAGLNKDLWLAARDGAHGEAHVTVKRILGVVALLVPIGVFACSADHDELPTTSAAIRGAAASAGIVSVSSGLDHHCALKGDGSLACWGKNASGQLGNGTTIDSAVPVAVPLPTRVTVVTAGTERTCALLVDGRVLCWGRGDKGVLGNGSDTSSLTPVQVALERPAIALSDAHQDHACAIVAGGDVMCWGTNRNSELGLPFDPPGAPGHSTPVRIQGLPGPATSVIVLQGATCALVGTGAFCWGSALGGTLGPDHAFGISQTPVAARVLGVRQLAASDAGICALGLDGRVSCWGLRFNGDHERTLPETVPLPGPAASLDGGGFHFCALVAKAALCWGQADFSEIVPGSTVQLSPVPIAGVSVGPVKAVSTGESSTCVVDEQDRLGCIGHNETGIVPM
jgi:alpha-tubulin suppressor-like RCC1 family protein